MTREIDRVKERLTDAWMSEAHDRAEAAAEYAYASEFNRDDRDRARTDSWRESILSLLDALAGTPLTIKPILKGESNPLISPEVVEEVARVEAGANSTPPQEPGELTTAARERSR